MDMTRRLPLHRPAIPLPLVIAVSIATFAATLTFVLTRSGALADAPPLAICVVAAILYLMSHLMRAVRIAVVAMPFMGISFRSAVLLHLFIAPWTLLLPFKLDEFLRLNELSRLSAAPERAVAAILIDRSMDGAVLILLSMLLRTAGYDQMAGFVGVLGIALTLVAIGFVLLPFLLETVQRQLFIYNHGELGLRALRLIDRAHLLLSLMRQTIRQGALFLFLATVGIWTLELLAVWLLVVWTPGASHSIAASAELMLHRADETWHDLVLWSSNASPLVTRLTAILLVSLTLIWPPVMLLYRRRYRMEPGRPRLPQRTGFSPLTDLSRLKW